MTPPDGAAGPENVAGLRIVEPLPDVGPPPCDTCGPKGGPCPLRADCAHMQLACHKFELYTRYGPLRRESDGHWYAMGQRGFLIRAKENLPTRERYDRLYRVD